MSQTSQWIREHADTLAEVIVARQYEQQPQVWKPYGAAGWRKSVRDTHYHLDYLVEALEASAPELFVEYLAWVKALFAGLHFPDDILPTTLACTRQVFAERLPEDVRTPALALVEAGLRSLPAAPPAPPSYLQGDRPLDLLACAYLAALLDGDRHTAGRIILEAVGAGTAIRDIYLHVFQRSQRELGRLWQTGQINVAQEHYCTAATQVVIAQLYPYLFAKSRKGPRLVATCVSGELHEIGARIVADFFEMEGWDTYFLGANTPVESVVRTVDERQADILAISATMTFHIGQVRALIAAARSRGLKARVLVGGYPFNIASDLWRNVGADGYAPDAQEAIRIAEVLLA
jgi:MerR family transcriptional regulator, light-induced transcriptional regulator